MKNEFLTALEHIAKADSNVIVAEVLAMFNSVNTMNPNEIIATYQTYWFFKQGMTNLDEMTSRRLGLISSAIVDRMFTLCCEPKDRNERARRVELFVRIGLKNAGFNGFSRAIDGYKVP
ncbi:MAG: hypothetical protein KGJ35_00445 [Patescibacteria group bacterium]|nr:hypothetical protein [Patescibacteria group bacterium]